MRKSGQGRRLIVLVASDHLGRQRLFAALADHDDVMTVGAQPAKVVEMLKQNSVYDVVMFELSSADLAPLKQIREVAPNLPILIIAGSELKFDNQRMCTELAPAALIGKPPGGVRADDLMCTLRAIVPEHVHA
jgi:chemotaxis response regulator CheB